MTYLKYLPKFNYKFGTKDIEVSDIFRRVAFTQETRDSPKNWKSYVMNGTETFDSLANKEYSDPDQYWQIMMMNNVVTRSDGPLNFITVEKAQKKFENEYSITLESYLTVQPDPGDFLVYILSDGTVTAQWAVIESYDPVHRSILTKTHSGLFSTTNSGILFHLKRVGSSMQFVQQITASAVSRYGNAPKYFYTNDGKISAYYVPSTNTFIDPEITTVSGTNCLLEQYIDNTLPTGYKYRSVSQDYMDGVVEKRNVKIPRQSTVLDVERAVEELLLNGNAEDVVNVEGVVFVGNTNTNTV